MKRLFIMCGRAFSGKTTIARQLASQSSCVYISLDDINEERGLQSGHGLPHQEWESTHAIATNRIKAAAASEQDIILDDTCCFRWLRDRYKRLSAEIGYAAELIYVEVSDEELQVRISQSELKRARPYLDPNVLAAHIEEFDAPKTDEKPTVLRNAEQIATWLQSRRKV